MIGTCISFSLICRARVIAFDCFSPFSILCPQCVMSKSMDLSVSKIFFAHVNSVSWISHSSRRLPHNSFNLSMPSALFSGCWSNHRIFCRLKHGTIVHQVLSFCGFCKGFCQTFGDYLLSCTWWLQFPRVFWGNRLGDTRYHSWLRKRLCRSRILFSTLKELQLESGSNKDLKMRIQWKQQPWWQELCVSVIGNSVSQIVVRGIHS